MSDQPEQQPEPSRRQRLSTWWSAAAAALREAWSWIKAEPTVFLALCVVTIAGAVFAKAMWDTGQATQSNRNTAQTEPAWTEQAQRLDARIEALEAAQATTLAERAPLLAPARPRAPSARQALAPAPAAAEPTPVPALPPITRQSLKQYRAELRAQE